MVPVYCLRLGLGWMLMMVLLTGVASAQAQEPSAPVSGGEVSESCGESSAAARAVLQGMLQFVEPGSDLETEIALILDLIEDGVDPETLKDDLLAVQEQFLEQMKDRSDFVVSVCALVGGSCICSPGADFRLCFSIAGQLCIGFCVSL